MFRALANVGQNSFQYATRMFPLFRAILKFYSTSRISRIIKILQNLLLRNTSKGMDGRLAVDLVYRGDRGNFCYFCYPGMNL